MLLPPPVTGEPKLPAITKLPFVINDLDPAPAVAAAGNDANSTAVVFIILFEVILFASTFADTDRLPDIFALVLVTTNTFVVPPTLILTFPSDTGILTLLVPLAKGPRNDDAETLPVKSPNPAIYAPLPETTSMLELPAALKLMFPFIVGILTLLVPLVKMPTRLPAVTLPVTPSELNVPTLVIFG